MRKNFVKAAVATLAMIATFSFGAMNVAAEEIEAIDVPTSITYEVEATNEVVDEMVEEIIEEATEEVVEENEVIEEMTEEIVEEATEEVTEENNDAVVINMEGTLVAPTFDVDGETGFCVDPDRHNPDGVEYSEIEAGDMSRFDAVVVVRHIAIENGEKEMADKVAQQAIWAIESGEDYSFVVNKLYGDAGLVMYAEMLGAVPEGTWEIWYSLYATADTDALGNEYQRIMTVIVERINDVVEIPEVPTEPETPETPEEPTPEVPEVPEIEEPVEPTPVVPEPINPEPVNPTPVTPIQPETPEVEEPEQPTPVVPVQTAPIEVVEVVEEVQHLQVINEVQHRSMINTGDVNVADIMVVVFVIASFAMAIVSKLTF